MPKKKDKTERRTLTLMAKNDFMAMEVTATISSHDALLPQEMDRQHRRISEQLYELARSMDFNPLEITIKLLLIALVLGPLCGCALRNLRRLPSPPIVYRPAPRR